MDYHPTIKKKHFLLIICHFNHFSFFKLFLNIAWYTLSAISGTTALTPIDVRYFWFDFLKPFVLEKIINVVVVGFSRQK